MLLVQKFNSLDEIDPEFKDSLESLLSSELPCLSMLNDFEKRCPTNLAFYYYLFFGHQHNRPVGFFFAQFVPLPESEFMSFTERMMQKIKKTPAPKSLRLAGPGATGTYWFFELKHVTQGLKEIKKVLSEIKMPAVLMSEEVSNSLYPAFLGEHGYREKKKLLLAPVTLKNNSYENYFNSLQTEEKNQLKTLWKHLTQNKQLEMTEITESFKLPRAEGISNYLKLNSTFIALNENNEVKGLIIFTKGTQQKLFVDFMIINHSDAYSPMSYLQNALMKAFDFVGFEQLIFSANPALNETYLGLSIEALEFFKLPVISQTCRINIHSAALNQNISKHDLSKYTTSY